MVFIICGTIILVTLIVCECISDCIGSKKDGD